MCLNACRTRRAKNFPLLTNDIDVTRSLVLKTLVIKVNAKKSTFRCRRDTIVKIKLNGYTYWPFLC